MKQQMIYTLVDRAWKLCSSYKLWHLEMEYLKTMMMSNGYTANFIERQIKRYLSNKYSTTSETNSKNDPKQGPQKFKVYIKLPYLGDATIKLESLIRHLKLGGIQLVVINVYRRIQHWFPYKDRTPAQMRHNVVYKLNYLGCSKCYIGETERNILIRLEEHQRTTGKLTSVGEHLKINSTHKFDFENVEILGQTDSFRIKYLETLFIQKYASAGNLINDAESSVPLNLFNIPINLKQGKH